MDSDDMIRGWKQIAVHLKVARSSAIEMAHRDGMPVRLFSRGRVCAFKSELAAWFRSRPRVCGCREATAA